MIFLVILLLLPLPQIALLLVLGPVCALIAFLGLLIPQLGMALGFLGLSVGVLSTFLFLPFTLIKIIWSVLAGRGKEWEIVEGSSRSSSSVKYQAVDEVRGEFLRNAQRVRARRTSSSSSSGGGGGDENGDDDYEWRALRDFDRRLEREELVSVSKTPVFTWSPVDVADAASRVGLGKFRSLIISSGLDGRVVGVITEQDLLQELGVKRFGDRKRLMLFLSELREMME